MMFREFMNRIHSKKVADSNPKCQIDVNLVKYSKDKVFSFDSIGASLLVTGCPQVVTPEIELCYVDDSVDVYSLTTVICLTVMVG
eukprot:768810-Hanusia_phi.AAC.23